MPYFSFLYEVRLCIGNIAITYIIMQQLDTLQNPVLKAIISIFGQHAVAGTGVRFNNFISKVQKCSHRLYGTVFFKIW